MTDDRELDGSDDDDAMQALIGKQLRDMYDSVLSEPIPDKIVELLVKLESVDLPREKSPGEPEPE